MDSLLLYGESLPPGDAAAAARYADNVKGLLLAVLSSAFIGASFIVKKKGLRRAGTSGSRAGSGGYRYLLEPLWWVGMVTMLVGEIANFAAYIFAPAVLVTPLGALSIIVSAVLAHFILKERLQRMGVLGCVLCIVGSTVIVLHAPEEKNPSSVEQIWYLATQPAFLSYAASAVAVSLVLILHCSPRYGQTNITVYLGICSVVGSLTVMSIKAVGISITLTLEGINQARYFQTWVFVLVSLTCIMIQLNYLNKKTRGRGQTTKKLQLDSIIFPLLIQETTTMSTCSRQQLITIKTRLLFILGMKLKSSKLQKLYLSLLNHMQVDIGTKYGKLS
ncbi:hypothetical protein KSP39_PZI006315 [Platanthera zijinensis]|uniref:Probable magnesium transporter n=1 Tax=Platanthera zijinensis TaxID=2320716 RepID=A0AAP0BSD9_9ASPA